MNAPDWGVVVENCAAYDNLTPEKQAEIVQMATDFLWLWTERTFGLETVTLRPCRSGCTGGEPYFSGSTWSAGKMMPTLVGGAWVSVGCGRCGESCGCDATPALRLPGPVASIIEVRIDGVAVAPANYRVDNARYLVRTDGGEWPTCQDMSADPEIDLNTFEITYERGIAVPSGGKAAASLLACQFAKAIVSPKSCDLPDRIQQITRQGVTVTVMNDFKEIESGKTGIWMIDSWVASVTRSPVVSTVMSPDIPRPRNRRTTWGG